MQNNYAKLIGRIAEKVGTQRALAEKINVSERSVSLKLNGIVGWKQDEIILVCDALDIAVSDIPEYFFNAKVQSD